ncbi:MAG: hypothetical protein ACRELD_05540 [Longimicrobiales bacterium]
MRDRPRRPHARPIRGRGAGATLICFLLVATAATAQQPALSVRPLAPADPRPVLRVGPVLADAALGEAVRSGLPLRLQFRVELWRDEWIDALVGAERWVAVILYDPLPQEYLLRVQAPRPLAQRLRSYTEARAAAETTYFPALEPSRPGRYYYTASLRVETLSLSDLEELEQWLKGELAPAVGGGSVGRAIEGGLKRLLIRMLGLPARAHEARSGYFRVR